MYLVVHALCCYYCCPLHVYMVTWSGTVLSCLPRFEDRNSSGRASWKEQTANQSAPGFLEDLQDYVSVTIHLLRFRLTDMSQDSGAGKVGHHPFRVYWSLRSVCSRSQSSTSYSSDGSWELGVKVKSPFRHIPVGTFPLQTQRLRWTSSLSYPVTRSIQSE